MNPAIESKSVYHSILDHIEMNRSLGSVCVIDFSVSTIEASILIRANLAKLKAILLAVQSFRLR
jgi:hypothetical protein